MAETLRCPVVLDVRVVSGTGGGPDKTILNSPRFLDPLGYRMLCAYLHPPADPGFDTLRKRADAQAAPLFEIADRGPWDWRVLLELYRVCRRERVTIYHGHDYKSNLLGLLLKQFRPMRLVTTVHGWVRHTARTPLYYRIDKLCLPRYEKVICVSHDLADECRRIGVGPRRLLLLENGIDLAAWERTASIPEARARLGFDPARPLVGAVGRLAPEKGFQFLIAAVSLLRKSGRPVQLLIVGGGEEESALRALIDQHGLAADVRLAGFQDEPKPCYEAMDVFALSSLREGLPNVLLEAMALGVPCVATAIAGVPRLIEHGVTGTLVPPGDSEALARALRELLDDGPQRRQLGAAGQRVVAERYSFATRMRRLAMLYDELLQPGSSRAATHGLAEATLTYRSTE